MAKYTWPKQGSAALLGTEVQRLDGPEKSTGAAKYAYDIVRPNMAFATLLTSPHPHAKIKSIDASPATKVSGVLKVALLVETMKAGQKVEPLLQYVGQPIAAIAAESPAAAAEGAKAIKVEYEVLDHWVNDQDLEAAKKAKRAQTTARFVALENEAIEDEKEEDREIEKLIKASDVVVEGDYGIQMITHCCLEPHGATSYWDGDHLHVWLSTQNVSGTPGQFGKLDVTRDKVTVHCDYIGGGFGSKFAADPWGVACAGLARDLKRPVKLMLDRDVELKIAGNRPSGFAKVRVGADKQGVIKVWDSHHWGTGGPGGRTVNANFMPYVFAPKNNRRLATGITTNRGPARAWRAPNHPQTCAMSHTAIDDIARKLGIDSYDVFMRNLSQVGNGKAEVYAEEMKIAAKLMDWKAKWHAHGKGPKKGSVVSGLGMALHMWGGGGHNSICELKVHPDGSVEANLGSQDLGTGTRTVIGMVVAETFGLPLSGVNVNIGHSTYPESGPSGGSTTVGGVSESSRRAAQDALVKLFELAAPKLEAKPEQLEAKNGRIQVKGNADKSLSWKEATRLLGMQSLTTQGQHKRGGNDHPLSDSGVGGVQMAEVEVDTETGVVRMKRFVAVQDMGLIINRLTAASQIYGACIMGIAYALFEEQIMDSKTGDFVNAQLADYKLPRLGDIGDIVVEVYEPASEYNRGVVGLGEPPVISPGGAISNAISNATGVRVPVLPATPDRVLAALKQA